VTVDETAIRQWADRHECRRNLPILIRRLIRETIVGVQSLRFPGNEAVDLSGLDGQLECDAGNAWVPDGKSIWEMGCDQAPRQKASEDYRKRTGELSESERKDTSYVFVTPRRWNKKAVWLEQCRSESEWKAVYVYDAIDLETWLEEAPVSSRWMGELLGVSEPGLMTPQEWWRRWVSASTPPISTKLVSTRRNTERETLLSELRQYPDVFSVQADDRKEAVAFAVASMIETDALDAVCETFIHGDPVSNILR